MLGILIEGAGILVNTQIAFTVQALRIIDECFYNLCTKLGYKFVIDIWAVLMAVFICGYRHGYTFCAGAVEADLD